MKRAMTDEAKALRAQAILDKAAALLRHMNITKSKCQISPKKRSYQRAYYLFISKQKKLFSSNYYAGICKETRTLH
ncbi:hypothetical protein ACTWKB_11600 [Bacillus sp. 4A_MP2]